MGGDCRSKGDFGRVSETAHVAPEREQKKGHRKSREVEKEGGEHEEEATRDISDEKLMKKNLRWQPSERERWKKVERLKREERRKEREVGEEKEILDRPAN